MITLEIPRVPPSLNELVGYGWRHRKRNTDLWKKEIWYELIRRGHSLDRKPFPRARVSIERRSRGELDPDNLVGSVKPIVDALRASNVLLDDTPKHIELVVTQTRSFKLPPRTLIEIESLPATT